MCFNVRNYSKKTDNCKVPFALNAGTYPGTKVNFILLGLAGTGKSACGNTILGQNVFTSRASSNPVTTECREVDAVISGRPVRVIDTPDIFDDDIKSSIKKKHVAACKQLCQAGKCVYLLVIHISRFTDCEKDILKKLEDAFGSRSQEQTVILFTRGDDLRRGNLPFGEFLRSCHPDLRRIIDRCGTRCVLFENAASGSSQVTELMQTVHKVLNRPDQRSAVQF